MIYRAFFSIILISLTTSCIGIQYGIIANTLIFNSAGTGMSGNSLNSNDREVETCIPSIAGLFAVGMASVESIAKKNNITKISSISYRHDMKQLINQSFCVIIRGQ